MPTAAARNSVRPNAARRAAFRMALHGRPCSACLLPVAFDGMSGRDRHAGSADLMHTIDVRDCHRYDTEVIVLGCRCCNDDARRAGVRDITADVESLPYDLPPQVVVNAWRETFARESAEDLPNATARRAARKARGLAW